jgi:uncharacterized protein YggE
MKRKLLLLGGAISFMFLMAAFLPVNAAMAAAIPEKNIVTVYGFGKTSVSPDKAMISVTVDAHEKTSKDVRKKIKEQRAALMVLLKSFGITSNDVQMTYYSVYPQYEFKENNERVATAYDASASLNINVTAVDKVAEIIDAISESENSNVNVTGSSFMLEKRDDALDQAREMAAKDAMARVQKLAKSLNIKIGNIINVSELNTDYGYPYYATGSSSEPTNIDVTMQLEVSYEIVP